MKYSLKLIAMRKLFTALFAMFLFSMVTWGQDTIRHLVISEVRWDGWENCYVELTNMGDTPVDLYNFYYGDDRGGANWEKVGDQVVFTGTPETLETDQKFIRCSGYNVGPGVNILQPGESTLGMMVYDEISPPFDWSKTPPGNARHTLGHVQYASFFNHGGDGGGDPNEKLWPYLPEYQMWGFD